MLLAYSLASADKSDFILRNGESGVPTNTATWRHIRVFKYSIIVPDKQITGYCGKNLRGGLRERILFAEVMSGLRPLYPAY